MDNYLEAKEGYILTNGDIYGFKIYLGEGIDKDTFYPIPIAEYEEILRQEEILMMGGEI